MSKNIKFFEKLIPRNAAAAALLSGSFGALILLLMMGLARVAEPEMISIYGFNVFCFLPLSIGVITPLMTGYYQSKTFPKSMLYSLLALLPVGAALIFSAFEGLICIIMASPIAVILTIIGSIIGYFIQKKSPARGNNVFRSLIGFMIFFPLFGFTEGAVKTEESVMPVVTSIEINAPPEKVWKNVVQFSELPPPQEAAFKTGIAYPIKAEIVGTGVGAVRYCIFTTGTFVEPIEVWDENKLLRFSVKQQPLPMHEISPYGAIDTPHLHDYLVSKQGQFKLTQSGNNKTLLEGTTWYYHKIRPEIYWKYWSEAIIHAIHQRVLNHIKNESEKAD